MENSWSQKRRVQLGQQKGIGPAFETRQSHTIEYRVNQIVPERYQSSLTPLSLARCGRLQLGVALWATSVALLQVVDNWAHNQW